MAPLIVHLIYRLDIGGLERVMLNCIHHMQQHDMPFRHVIVSLTDANNFAQDANHPIPVYCLNKAEGNDFSIHVKLFKLLKQLKPDILHSYNFSTIEYHPIAWLAGVKGRIHAEHGRDSLDPQGLNKKHNLLRKLVSPFIHRFIPVSNDLAQWLISTVGINATKVTLIYNGINLQTFNNDKSAIHDDRPIILGIVARLTPVKDHRTLLASIALLFQQNEKQNAPKPFELWIIGDGPLREALERYASELGINKVVKFLGARDDIAELLQQVNIFILSSIAEGIPMTILEAMAAKTPIIATRVGGVPEIIESGKQGYLVDKQQPEQLATAIQQYLDNPTLIAEHAINARDKVVKQFSEHAMVQQYVQQYEALSK